MRKCHKEISQTETSPGVWTHVMCNRNAGHRGRCSRKTDCHRHPDRISGHRDCEPT